MKDEKKVNKCDLCRGTGDTIGKKCPKCDGGKNGHIGERTTADKNVEFTYAEPVAVIGFSMAFDFNDAKQNVLYDSVEDDYVDEFPYILCISQSGVHNMEYRECGEDSVDSLGRLITNLQDLRDDLKEYLKNKGGE